MKKIIRKLSHILIKSALVAGATKVALVVLQKANKDGKLQDKADAFIDEKADAAKQAAKAGVHKTIEFAQKEKSIEETTLQ